MSLKMAAKKARHWTQRRDELIYEAVEAGEPLRKIAAQCGLSHTAVAKIATRRGSRRDLEDAPADPLRDGRTDRVADHSQAVHVAGKPISHSAKRGFTRPPTM